MIFPAKELKAAALGGLIAEVAFEAYAWLLSPIVFGPELQPAKLLMALSNTYFGLELSYLVAFTIHAFIGVIGFGLFTLLFFKALKGRLLLSGFIAGVCLWFVAQGLLAPAIGRDFMMNFGVYTQSSFVAHVGMTIIIALFLGWRLKEDRTVG